MILVTENAELQLQKALHVLREKKAAAKCIKLKHERTDDNELLAIVKCISTVVGDTTGSMTGGFYARKHAP